MSTTPALEPPESFNIADYFLDDRVRDGMAGRIALRTDAGDYTYDEVRELANRYASVLRDEGVQPEQRVILALSDGPHYVAALFGVLKIGGVVVMVNPHVRTAEFEYFLEYTRTTTAIVGAEFADAFAEAAAGARHLRATLTAGAPALDARLDAASAEFDNFPTHRDDAAIWLFSGGTSGRPKAVVQTHRSYANSTECYGKGVLGLTPDDITISVPKLFFGYAMGSNLFFPFSVGASCVLFPDRCTPAALFDRIERFSPTVLINVPTMIQQMLSAVDAGGIAAGAADADARDLSSLRLATSAGEALPVELYRRWKDVFDVELLDGLGTAEMWHVFISNRLDDVKPGTLGRAVPGFDVRVRDDAGNDVPDGEVGYLWVRGASRGIAYWQNMDATTRAFRGEWYVSEDMLSRDADGYFTYRGRADDMLKVSGKWLAPGEIENCLLEHPAVREVAVVGVVEDDGLTRPHAYVVAAGAAGSRAPASADLDALCQELQGFVKQRLASYKTPRRLLFLDELPRTHLGKVDRGQLRTANQPGIE